MYWSRRPDSHRRSPGYEPDGMSASLLRNAGGWGLEPLQADPLRLNILLLEGLAVATAALMRNSNHRLRVIWRIVGMRDEQIRVRVSATLDLAVFDVAHEDLSLVGRRGSSGLGGLPRLTQQDNCRGGKMQIWSPLVGSNHCPAIYENAALPLS